ncbi:MAG: D-alanine--D-alanine ligase [Bacteroidaceae bacterium]|nr:D-alanine--D-alanine ligase [Bacteroidaceae bacterium]
MKRKIAIIAGGDSSEHDVSLRSAAGIDSFLDHNLYDVATVILEGPDWYMIPDGPQDYLLALEDKHEIRRVPIDKNDFSYDGTRPDFCYITIHGTPGEDGTLQGYFDMLRIPYNTSGVLVEALTFNKFTCNQYMKSYGVSVSESMVIRRGYESLVTDSEIIDRIGLPCFVKPNCGGSSFCTTKVKTIEELQPALALAMTECPEVMVESFMQGTEVTCGCYKTAAESVVLPLTEVVPKVEFFDYDAKYKGLSDEITPARIPEDTAERIRLITSTIYDILNCRGIIRIDYIITHPTSPDGTTHDHINLLEINTTPGMTPTSFIPQQIRAANRDITAVLTSLIEDHFQ